MSRAFVSENDSWEYCPKAGERCMLAETHSECTSADCPHASKPILSNDDGRQDPEKRDKFVKVNRETKATIP